MAEISQIKLPNNTVLDLKDVTARSALADMSKVHVIELTYYDTINDVAVYTSENTNLEVKTMIDNGEVVIIKVDKAFFYFYYCSRISDMSFYQSGGTATYGIAPYAMNNTYTNYWQMLDVPQKVRVVHFTYDHNDDYSTYYTSDLTYSQIIQYVTNGAIIFGLLEENLFSLAHSVSTAPRPAAQLLFTQCDTNGITALRPYNLSNNTNVWQYVRQGWPEEDTVNVNEMLTNMGLSTTAYFNKATVGTAEPEHSIVQDIT